MARLLGAVVVLIAPCLAFCSPAGADQVETVQAQIQALQGQISSSAGRLHALTTQFEQANLTAGDLAQQLSVDQANLAISRAQVAKSEAVLRNSALTSYTGEAGAPLQSIVTALDPGVSSAYMDVAIGDLSDSVDDFDLRERQLENAAATLSDDERAAQVAQHEASAAQSAALASASSTQVELASLQSRLDQLQAAQVAAAAAAQTAAPPSPAQGGPSSNGLVAVVTSIVKAPAPAATVAPAQPAAPPPTAETGGNAGGPWLQLRECESGDNYRENTGNGFYGAYQFSWTTWTRLGYPGRPDLEPPAMQDAAAKQLQALAGWGQWPACSAALGL